MAIISGFCALKKQVTQKSMTDTSFIDKLNRQYAPLSPFERLVQLYADFSTEEVLLTSSFGTTAVYLLHHIHLINRRQKVHFIDTGYHFGETMAYKARISSQFGLQVLDVRPHAGQHQLTRERQTWQHNPDLCCKINKVLPMQALRASHRVWVSGLLGEQTSHRNKHRVFEWHDDILKFHPMIDQPLQAVKEYIARHGLPVNPLLQKGYGSVGCVQCTHLGDGRSGRWKNSGKTECGLHLRGSARPDNKLLCNQA